MEEYASGTGDSRNVISYVKERRTPHFPLARAIFEKDMTAASNLLSNGCGVTDFDRFYAISEPRFVELFLSRSLIPSHGIIMTAIFHHYSCALRLVEKLQDVNQFGSAISFYENGEKSYASSYGTLLMMAARNDNVPVARKLLECHGDPNIQCTYGHHAFLYVRSFDVCRLLLEYGADPPNLYNLNVYQRVDEWKENLFLVLEGGDINKISDFNASCFCSYTRASREVRDIEGLLDSMIQRGITVPSAFQIGMKGLLEKGPQKDSK